MKNNTKNLILSSVLAALSATLTQAATYQWRGTTSTDWTVSGNWLTGTGLTAGPAPTNGTFAHRLNVNNAANNEAVYTAAQGTTIYNNGTGNRGLVIGSGGSGNSGTLRITGGSFSTVGSTGGEIIGNGAGNIGTLIIDGGNYTAGATLNFGIGAGPTSILTVNSGTATVPTISINANTANLNLNGGTLELNNITRTFGTATININGGTLKARQNNAAFLADLATTNVFIKSNGAIIDSNGFNISIGEPLLTDVASTGGGLTKNGAGILTLTGANTYTGETKVNAGKLILPASITSLAKTTIASGATLGLSANTTGITTPELVSNGGVLDLNLGLYNASNPSVINATTLTANSSTVINISGSSIPVGTIDIITYGSKSGTFTLGTLPSNMAATLNDTGSKLQLIVTSPSATSFAWSVGTGSWDTTTANWNGNAAVYGEPALASFPTAGAGVVTLTADRAPLSVSIDSSASYFFDGPGLITGSTGITKTGSGLAYFTAANSYTGNVSVQAGAIVKELADTTTGNITVANGAAFALGEGVTDGAGQTINIAGPGLLAVNGQYAAVQRGSITALIGNNTWAGNVVFDATANTRIGVQDNTQLTISGSINESVIGSTLAFRHGNTAGSNITLSSASNNWTGATQIYGGGGALILGVDNALPTAALLQVGTSSIVGASTLDLNGFQQTAAGLTRVNEDIVNGSIITNNGTVDSTLTLNPLINRNYSGIIKDGTTNKINLAINGLAIQQLSGINTYTGSTAITAGTLRLAGAGEINGTSTVTVNGATAAFVTNSSAIVLPNVNLTAGSIDGTGILTNVTVADSATNVVNHGNGTTDDLGFDNLTFQGDAKINIRTDNLNSLTVTSALTTNGANGSVVFDILQAPTLKVGDEIPLINYGSFSGNIADFSVGTVAGLSGRQVASIIDTGSAITLKIGGQDVRWSGAQSGVWSTTAVAGSFNWKEQPANTGTEFLANDTVTFGDDATGTTDIVINDNTVTPTGVVFDNNVLDYTLSGSDGIATGSLTKRGLKKLTISTPNLYDGATNLIDGVIHIQNNNALGSTVGNTVIGTNAALQLSGAITSAENLVVSSSGENFDGAIRSISGNNVLTGTVALGSSGTVIAVDSDSLLIDSVAGITGAGFGLNIIGDGNTTITAGIKTGAGANLTKEGNGVLTLNGPNTYTGATTVNGGSILFNNSTFASSSFLIESNAVVEIKKADDLTGVATTFSGAGTLRKTGIGNLIWQSPIVTYQMASGALIDVQEGTLTAGSNNNDLWTNNLSDLHVASGATLNGVEANVVVDVITGSGTISTGYNIASYINGAGFTIGADNGSGSFDGLIINGSFPGKIVKAGSGTQKLNGANTYTGTTAINGGTLVINGLQSTANGAVSIASGATLAGIGTLGGAVTNNGTIAPGDAGIGTLTVAASTSNAGAQWAIQYNATTADKLTANGNLNLDNTVLNLAELSAPTASSYVIAECTGTLSGTFANEPTLPSGYKLVIDTIAKQVRIELASAYATWASAKGLTAANDAATADPDGDGHNNLAEFAFDGHPLQAGNGVKSHVFTTDSDADLDTNNELVLTIAVRKDAPAFAGSPLTSSVDGIVYTIEGSSDLVDFSNSVIAVPTAITTNLPATSSADYVYRSFSLSGSNSLTGKGFLRAKVTKP
jgi:autotransporter-associated beta strand protein